MWKLMSFFDLLFGRKPTAAVSDNELGLAQYVPRRPRIKLFPHIEVEVATNHHKSFTSPNPDIKATVYSSDRTAVGEVTYAVSPLFDRLYIFNITVHAPYRRQGFGLAIIEYIAMTYDVPITTIKEVFSASEFWSAARYLYDRPNEKIETLSISEMDRERARWAHLKPHIDQLDEQISDRLFNKRESWESAIGRGLPDWPSSTPQSSEATIRS